MRTKRPTVVFEDASLVAIDKQGVELAAPIADGLRRVHNPDPVASGLLVFAKTKRALDFLSGQFQSKSVEQVYHAFCVVTPEAAQLCAARCARATGLAASGALPSGFAIDWWIGTDREAQGRMRAFRRNGGEPALSEFRVLERFGRFAFLECSPRSNRRHQLRVHLAAAGLPVLNDATYGLPEEHLLLSAFKRGYKGGDAERAMIEQVALHASSFTLRHPESGQPFTLTAPLPKAFEVSLRNLRRFSRGGGRLTCPPHLVREGSGCGQ